MPYRMYDVCKKKLGVCWGLVDKISPAFELRNSGVPAVVRSSQLPYTPQRGPKFNRGGVWPPDGAGLRARARLAIRRQLSRQSPVAFFERGRSPSTGSTVNKLEGAIGAFDGDSTNCESKTLSNNKVAQIRKFGKLAVSRAVELLTC
jgi:hypothetical protein